MCCYEPDTGIEYRVSPTTSLRKYKQNNVWFVSAWYNAIISQQGKCDQGITHYFSKFAAKMNATKPNTLEHRRHGYRAISLAISYVARRTYTPYNPKLPIHITAPKTIAHLDIAIGICNS